MVYSLNLPKCGPLFSLSLILASVQYLINCGRRDDFIDRLGRKRLIAKVRIARINLVGFFDERVKAKISKL